MCYYESWVKQSGAGSYPPSSIPAKKCSHIVYSFITPKTGGAISTFNDGATLNKLVALNLQNTKLKIMVGIGSASAGSTVFSKVGSRFLSVFQWQT